MRYSFLKFRKKWGKWWTKPIQFYCLEKWVLKCLWIFSRIKFLQKYWFLTDYTDFHRNFFLKIFLPQKRKKIKFVLIHPKVKNLLFLLLKFLFSNHSFVSFVFRFLRRTRKRAATYYSFIFFWSFYRKFWVNFFVRFL